MAVQTTAGFSTTPPSVDGFYWLRRKRERGYIVEVSAGKCCPTGWDIFDNMANLGPDYLWYGPLPEPDWPVEDSGD